MCEIRADGGQPKQPGLVLNINCSSLHAVNFIVSFTYILAVLGLCCCSHFSLVPQSRDYSVVAVYRLLIAVASLVAEHGF